MSLRDLQEFVKTYNIAVYRLMASGRSAPSAERFEAFEESIDFDFPDDFREFSLSPLGGLSFRVCEDLWPAPESEDAEDWHRLFGINVFGIGAGVPPWLDLREELSALPAEETDLVPFMGRGDDPHRYCFDMDHQIVRWCPKSGKRELVGKGFYELLLSEIHDLEERRELFMDAARGKKSRKRKKVAN